MRNVILKLGSNGYGDFLITGKKEQLAKMGIGVAGIIMTVHHTYIAPKAEGRGFGKKLLVAMVEYVRKNQLKVIPFCHFVNRQFNRHPKKYADVWYKGEPVNQLKSEAGPLASA